MSNNLIFLILGALAVGILYLGYILFDIKKRFFSLFPGNGEKKEIFSDLVERLAKAEVKIDELNDRTKILESISRIAVQKVGFKRFNPFSDTGGDNSFALVLLDRQNNGIMISSLYTREGVRIYGKKIDSGEPRSPLSDEEKEVLKQALA